VATFIRSTGELVGIAAFEPFTSAELKAGGDTLYIGFLEDSPTKEAIEKLLSLTSEVDDFQCSGREFFWLCRKSFSESSFSGTLLERIIGMRATLRNSTTVRKIALKYR